MVSAECSLLKEAFVMKSRLLLELLRIIIKHDSVDSSSTGEKRFALLFVHCMVMFAIAIVVLSSLFPTYY